MTSRVWKESARTSLTSCVCVCNPPPPPPSFPRKGRPIEPQEVDPPIQERLRVFLQLGTVPKSRYVIADAIKLHRQRRGEQADDSEQRRNEDALLDFVNHLSTTPAGLYQLP